MPRIIGSALSKLDNFELTAADEQHVEVKNNFFSKIALQIFGIPHIGLWQRSALIFKNLPKNFSGDILDAGCGNGVYTIQFAAEGLNINGLEIDSKKVKRVQNYIKNINGKSDVSELDLTNISECSQYSYDLIICSDVLEHIKDDKSAMTSLANMLKEDGILLLTVPRVSDFFRKTELSFGHERVGYLEDELEKELKDRGIEAIHFEQYFKFFARFAWKCDRSLRKIKILKVLFFYPLYCLTFLDKFLPTSSNAGGIFLKAKKNSSLLSPKN